MDLIGNGFFDFYPGNGLYVDLDGSTGQAGLMATNNTFAAGTYNLQFDLGGSQRGDSNDVTVSLGNYTHTFTVASSDPLVTVVVSNVTVSGPGSVLSFQNAGGDNVGAILDNVNVNSASAVPEMSTVVGLGSLLGLGGLGLLRRRK